MSKKPQTSTEARLGRLDDLLGPSSNKQAKSASKLPKKASSKKSNAAKPAKQISPKQIRQQSYATTMSHVEKALNPLQRSQSKFMRLPIIDELSLIASKTIFRPSALIGAGIVAALGMIILLYVARTIGFTVSGSELFILLVVGWIIGLLVEGLNSIYSRLTS